MTAIVLVGCPGPRPPTVDHPVSGGSTRPGSTQPPPTTPAAPTEDECAALIAHAMELGVTARTPDQRPTPAELATIRTELDAELRPGCRTLTRPQYACAMAATATDALVACDLLHAE